jgi:hypothetical protein
MLSPILIVIQKTANLHFRPLASDRSLSNFASGGPRVALAKARRAAGMGLVRCWSADDDDDGALCFVDWDMCFVFWGICRLVLVRFGASRPTAPSI